VRFASGKMEAPQVSETMAGPVGRCNLPINRKITLKTDAGAGVDTYRVHIHGIASP
jgi:hypothetical protein